MSKILCAAASIIAASLTVIPTVASAQEARSVQVSYADLDLSNAGGEAALARRIDRAAQFVCGEGTVHPGLDVATAVRQCRATAVADARPAFEAAVRAARAEVEVLTAALTVGAPGL